MVGPAHSSSAIALALGGGGARGLAHLGVLQVLEAEGLQPMLLAGTSIGGLLAALSACGIAATDIVEIARGFRFPRYFIPGRILGWHQIFPTAVPLLENRDFGNLTTPLLISAVDLQRGEEVVLHAGPILPAVRATCAVPGVLAPERIGARQLVDGAVMNVLPVDVAWTCEPDAVVAVNVRSLSTRPTGMDSRYARLATRLGRVVPNPLTARRAFETAMRAVEVSLDRQTALACAMTGPEILIDVNIVDVSLRDFRSVDRVVAAGREAAQRALPRLVAVFRAALCHEARPVYEWAAHLDPVCGMVVSRRRAHGRVTRDGVEYFFCSTSCRDNFERDPYRYRDCTAPAVEA